MWFQRIRRNEETKVKSGWNNKINGIRLDKELAIERSKIFKGIGIKHNGKCIEMN